VEFPRSTDGQKADDLCGPVRVPLPGGAGHEGGLQRPVDGGARGSGEKSAGGARVCKSRMLRKESYHGVFGVKNCK